MTDNYLEVKEKYKADESIEKMNYVDYDPYSGGNLNTPGAIRIQILNQDEFLLPSRSYIHLEGNLLDNEDNRIGSNKPGSGDKNEYINLINNAFMYLFDSAYYRINNSEIEGYNNLGQATTIKSLITYPSNFAEGHQFLWIPDHGDKGCVKGNTGYQERHDLIVADYPELGTFTAAIPLSHIFGFAENYEKIMYGMKHELILHRSHDANDAILKSKDTDLIKLPHGKVVIKRLTWRMMHVTPSDVYRLKLGSLIKENYVQEISYLRRQCECIDMVPNSTQLDWSLNIASGGNKPRFIVLAFQVGSDNDQLKNPAIFDHLSLTNAYVQLNTERYPEMDLQLNFEENQVTTTFQMLVDYFTKVLGKSNFPFSLREHRNLYPLLLFDTHRQSEKLKNAVTDIRIKAQFAKNIPIKAKAYALILSDQTIKLRSDGMKMNFM